MPTPNKPETSLSVRGVSVPPFYAGEISLHADKIRRAGGDVIPMHFGAPTAGPPQAALEAARRSLDAPDLGYHESTELKDRLVRHYADTYGVAVSADQILLANGASAALTAIFSALFGGGDRVVVTRPGYPAYRHTLAALGRRPVEIDCGVETDYELSTEMLDRLDAPINGLLVASPANPTGATLSKVKMASLAAYCRHNEAWFISDEIYHGITFESPAVCALAVDPNAVIIGSFSKLYRMPGWRLGWLIAPPEAIARIRTHLINFLLTPPAISQLAALAAMDQMPELLQAVNVYRQNRDLLVSELPRCGFGKIISPRGAFYVYADAAEMTGDSLQFCLRVLERTGVALAPGIDFDSEHGNSTIRFSFAISTDAAQRAVGLLRTHLPALRSRR